MGARRTPARGCTTGNFVAEWFGHRVWPDVNESDASRRDQSARLCPFLTIATGESASCIKRAHGWDEPYGVCTVSSDSNGVRQDWIACPHRTLDQRFTLLTTAIRNAYAVENHANVLLLPLTVLHREDQRARIRAGLASGSRLFLFASQKLGGEIDLPETDASPGAAVDMSVIEVLDAEENGKPLTFGNHLFYEIQTSDFHGSPLHAAALLRDSCPRGEPTAEYHSVLKSRVEICGTGVEGPNKANIFKRTIYQMIFKIELARDPQCAGFAIILPIPVWDSWLKHLGRPELIPTAEGSHRVALTAPSDAATASGERARATVYVFDIDRTAAESPHPLQIVQEVEVSADALAYHSFVRASNEALQGGVIATFRRSMIQRVQKGWNDQLRSRSEGEPWQTSKPLSPVYERVLDIDSRPSSRSTSS